MGTREKRRGRTGGRKVSRHFTRWEKEVTKLEAFLHDLKTVESMGTEKWRDSMIAHYTQRIEELRKKRPRKYETT